MTKAIKLFYSLSELFTEDISGSFIQGIGQSSLIIYCLDTTIQFSISEGNLFTRWGKQWKSVEAVVSD